MQSASLPVASLKPYWNEWRGEDRDAGRRQTPGVMSWGTLHYREQGIFCHD